MTAMTLHDRENLHTHARTCHGKFRILSLSLHRYVHLLLKYSRIKKVHLQGICRVIFSSSLSQKVAGKNIIISASFSDIARMSGAGERQEYRIPRRIRWSSMKQWVAPCSVSEGGSLCTFSGRQIKNSHQRLHSEGSSSKHRHRRTE